jgi:hypothetical protein
MPSERRADRPTVRRAADRHYLAVVAAEARRLGRELRPDKRDRGTSGPRMAGPKIADPTIVKHSRPAGAH